MDKLVYLAAGGVLGTIARYGLTVFVTARAGVNFPLGTLVVNMLGCFLVGFLDILAERKFSAHPQLRFLLVTGFCGAFTTFSAFVLESYALIRSGDITLVMLNMIGSSILGLVCLRVGMLLADKCF